MSPYVPWKDRKAAQRYVAIEGPEADLRFLRAFDSIVEGHVVDHELALGAALLNRLQGRLRDPAKAPTLLVKHFNEPGSLPSRLESLRSPDLRVAGREGEDEDLLVTRQLLDQLANELLKLP